MTTSTNFLAALKSGQEAALQAEKNREEIDAVLLDLKKQVLEFSGNQLVLSRTPSGPSEAVSPELRHHVPAQGKQPKDGALFLWKGGEFRELCTLSLGPRGYPVEINYLRRYINAYDRESLVEELNELLASPQVGRIVNEFLGSPRAPTPTPANDGA